MMCIKKRTCLKYPSFHQFPTEAVFFFLLRCHAPCRGKIRDKINHFRVCLTFKRLDAKPLL